MNEYLLADEHSYLFQAWLFSQGKIMLEAPPITEVFFHQMIINDARVGWLSRYPPGHSLWLTIGVILDNPRLAIAISTSISVWLIVKAGEILNISTWQSIWLLCSSPFFWLMQGTVLSHTSGLMMTALMVYAYLNWLKNKKLLFLAAFGIAWAILFLNRTYTAVLLFIPFFIHFIITQNNARISHFSFSTFIFILCSGSGVIIFFLYNYLSVGDPFTPTYLYYNDKDTVGFGIRHREGFNFTPEIGASYIKENLETLNIRLWGFKGSLFAWIVLVIIGLRNRSKFVFLFLCLLSVWLGYGTFWYKGVKELAPIYYYETLVFIVLLSGLGLNRVISLNWRIPALGKMCVCILVMMCWGIQSIKTFSAISEPIIQKSLEKKQYSKIIKKLPTESIILVSNLPSSHLYDVSWNQKGLYSKPLMMRNIFGVTHVIPHYFPNLLVYHINSDSVIPLKKLDGKVPILYAENLHSTTGDIKDKKRIAKHNLHSNGFLARRGYQYMMPGEYEVRYHLKAKGTPGKQLGLVELVEKNSKRQLAKKEILDGDTQISISVSVDKLTIVEPRVYFNGLGSIEFSHVEMIRRQNNQNWQTLK